MLILGMSEASNSGEQTPSTGVRRPVRPVRRKSGLRHGDAGRTGRTQTERRCGGTPFNAYPGTGDEVAVNLTVIDGETVFYGFRDNMYNRNYICKLCIGFNSLMIVRF